MFKIMTLKKQKFSLSDPILIRQFSKKLQSDPVLLRPKFATVLIRAHLCRLASLLLVSFQYLHTHSCLHSGKLKAVSILPHEAREVAVAVDCIKLNC